MGMEADYNWDMRNNFECKKCGDCCKDYTIPLGQPLHPDQVEYLKARGFEYRIMGNRHYLYRHEVCPQLKEDNECFIYGDRPAICKRHQC